MKKTLFLFYWYSRCCSLLRPAAVRMMKALPLPRSRRALPIPRPPKNQAGQTILPRPAKARAARILLPRPPKQAPTHWSFTFSWSGNTENVAKAIQSQTDSDIFLKSYPPRRTAMITIPFWMWRGRNSAATPAPPFPAASKTSSSTT